MSNPFAVGVHNGSSDRKSERAAEESYRKAYK